MPGDWSSYYCTPGDWSISLFNCRQTGKFNFLDLATRLIHRLPASSGTTSVQLAMHLSFKISLRTFLLTLAPRAYATYYHAVNTFAFLRFILFRKVKWAHFTRKEIFFNLEHHAFFEQPASSMIILINCLSSWSKYRLQLFGRFFCLLKTSSLTDRRSSRRRVTSQYMVLGD